MKYNVIHNFKGIKNVDFDLFQFSVYIMLCKREMEICFHLNFFFFFPSPLCPIYQYLLMQNFMAMHAGEPLGSGQLVLISAPKIEHHQMPVYL